MKILATGDLHLGASPDLGATPGDRLRDQEQVWLRICRLAIDEEVDALLFAGDAFHRRRPTPSEIVAFRNGLDILNKAGCDVIAIAGNHDVEAAHLPSGLETSPSHALYEVSRRPELFPLRSGGAVVATLPWTPPGQLAAARNGGDRDELNHDVAQLLLTSAAELHAQIPEGKQAILLAHWSVSGAVTPTGADVGIFREPVLPLADLHALGFDAIVLGHIHKPQVLGAELVVRSENGLEAILPSSMVFYVGSPCVIDWGEAESEHGVFVIDGENRASRFVEIEDRRFLTLDVDLSAEHPEPPLDETDALAAALAAEIPFEGALVRLRYKASSEQARHIDHAALRNFCLDAGAAKLIVRPEIIRADRARVEGVDESLSELEALQRWSDVHDLDEAQRERLAVLTNEYLEAA